MASVNRRKWGSYPSVSVVGSMLLALTVLGLFGLFVMISNNLSTAVKENIQIQVYLNKELSENQRQLIEKTLGEKEYILIKDQSPVMSFVSKETAAKQFIEDTGEDFYEFLGENPLRDSYVININYNSEQTVDLPAIKADIESISGVFEVDFVENMINSINDNITRISIILIGFSLVLLIVVVILINNTIKLALFSQRFLIRSMQLVGAKASFIQKPFLFRSSLHGMLAGLLSSIILFGILLYGQKNVPELELLYTFKSLIILFCSIIVVGAIVGLSGTYFAVKKYLRLSLDELY